MPEVSVVEVHWAYPSPLEEAADLLDVVERQRLDTLQRPRDRDRYLSAHILVRLVLAEHTGLPPYRQRFTRTCRICGGPHGKPRLVLDPERGLPTPQVSLSYAGNRILVAYSTTAELGVDVERWSSTAFPGFSSLALTEEEARELLGYRPADRTAAKTVWWVRKEAALKATGHGLRVDTSAIRITPPDQPPRLLAWNDAEVPEPILSMGDIPVGGQYAAAVAILGEYRLDIRMFDDNHRLSTVSVS